MNDRSYDVSVYVHPINNKNKIRIFEISNKCGGESRFTDVDRNTGEEYFEFFRISGSPNVSDHEGIKSYLKRNAEDYLNLNSHRLISSMVRW